MMITGHYYDGRKPVAVPAKMEISGREARFIAGELSEQWPLDRLLVSPRIENAQRFVTLPNGGQFKCDDHFGLQSLPQESPSEGLVAWLEERWGVALAAVALIVCVVLATYFYGLPIAAERIANHIPIETEKTLGLQAINWLDSNGWLKPTEIDQDRQKIIKEGFGKLISDLPFRNTYKLEFRNAPMFGANAFAFPGGIIVMTDGMVLLAESPEEVFSVLAHEIGHVELRHAMRGVLQNSAVAIIAATLTSDAASLSTAVAGLPVVFAQAKYSREFEMAADDYGFNLMRQKGHSPAAFAAIMERLSQGRAEAEQQFAYVSSHPVTSLRIQRARAAAGVQPVAADAPTKGWLSARADLYARERIGVANAALKKSCSLGKPNNDEINQLLAERNFRVLDIKFEDMLTQYKNEAEYEDYLRKAFESFTPGRRGVSAPIFNSWVEHTGSYVSYAARGTYKTHQGFKERGTKKKRLHEDAARDLQKALSLNPRLMPAYEQLIRITSASPVFSLSAKELLDRALAHDPRSYYVRLAYLATLEPAPGGPVDAMNMFAQEAAKAAQQCPRAWTLQGAANAHVADALKKKANYAAAVEEYTKALAFGDHVSWLENRAACYEKLGQRDKAMEDYKRILSYDSQNGVARQGLASK